MSVFGQIESLVGRHPDRTLFSFLGESGRPGESLTYASFLERVDIIASHLLARPDLSPGDRVLLVYPQGLEIIAALFACVRAGMIPVPTAPPSPSSLTAAVHRMEHVARDCEPKVMLTNHGCNDMLLPLRSAELNGSTPSPAIAGLDWLVSENLGEAAGPIQGVKESDTFLLQYTSGSTNDPKGVVVSQANILANCDLVVDHRPIIGVSWLPQHHDMGLLGYYIYILLTGGTTYGLSPNSFIRRPALWFETITKYQGTASSAPNFAYDYCLRRRWDEEVLESIDLSSLQFLMAAAEPINPDVYRRFLQKFQRYGLNPKRFFVAYGLAENTLAVTNYGRNAISVSRRALALDSARKTEQASEIGDSLKLMSCGVPLGDNQVKIVDAGTREELDEGKVGEIWITGSSKCSGYWGRPEISKDLFQAKLYGDKTGTEWLRTGDMGFFDSGELYVCGRLKDMLILRGQNYYPQDIEVVVEQVAPAVRAGSVVAFQIDDAGESGVAIVAGLAGHAAPPDPAKVVSAVRNQLGLEVAHVTFVPGGEVPKTSSGKIKRYETKRMWMDGEFTVQSEFVHEKRNTEESEALQGPLAVLARYGLEGNESYTLVEAGIDSVDMVLFMHELKNVLADNSDELLARQVDIRLIQRFTIADIFTHLRAFEADPTAAVNAIFALLKVVLDEHLAEEGAMMTEDRKLAFELPPIDGTPLHPPQNILLIGGTGFLGPFLLSALLQQTTAQILVLTRGTSNKHVQQRVRSALEALSTTDEALLADFDARVQAIRGDLERPRLGLSDTDYERITSTVDAIYHNGAVVNYLLNYKNMRAANVNGTNEVVRLAATGRPKVLNHVSTTFIYGWAVKPALYEHDRNDDMYRLDFGYSQTKWVSEQIVFDAASQGLPVRVFRPSLITPSVAGDGSSPDITLRLVAFMVNHAIGVDTQNQVSFLPADVNATNIVAIANQPDTIGGSFHVVRDDYNNFVDVTDILREHRGHEFEMFPLATFVPELVRRCTRADPLFPLIDFLVGSVDNISKMEFKRYDSTEYQKARDASPHGVPDPSLEDTVLGILRFMDRTNML